MDRISREFKLLAAKDIVANFARSERNASADEICELFRKVYRTIDEVAPEPESRKVGLG